MRKESSHMLIFMFHRMLIKCVKSDFIIKYLYLNEKFCNFFHFKLRAFFR